MIDPASIRSASFSLTPTGYNPEEVDRFLAELADATSSIDLAEVRNASFSLTPTGYNPEEVDQFLGSIADQLADASASQPESFQREEQPVAEHQDQYQYEPVAEVEDESVAAQDDEVEPHEIVHEPTVEEHHEDEAEVEHEADDVYQPVAEHDGWHQPEAAGEPELVLVESIPDEPAGEPPVASLPEAIVAERAHADLGSLSAAMEAAIESLDGFVKNELHNLREASALEVDDILAERQRLIEDATSVGRRHIDEASAHAEKIVNKARKEGDRMRQQARAGAARGARPLRAVARRPRCPGPGPRDRDPGAGGGPAARGRRAGCQRGAGTGFDAGVIRAGPQLADPGRRAEPDLLDAGAGRVV